MKVREKKKVRKKKRSVLWLLTVCIGCIVTAGCAGKPEDELVSLSEITSAREEADDANQAEGGSGQGESAPEDAQSRQEKVQGQTDAAPDFGGLEDMEASASQDAGTEQQEIYVYVCGAVNQPGVYRLPLDARVFEAIELAGGLRGDASASSVNQARKAEDGQKIYIPTAEEAKQGWTEEGLLSGEVSAAGETKQTESEKVNINTATREELMTLPGIGETKAESIIAYRQQYGMFGSVEELMKVEGIKTGVFDKVKDKITV